MNYVFAKRWDDGYGAYRFTHMDNLQRHSDVSIALLDDGGAGIDFVRFGYGGQGPPAGVDWFGQFGSIESEVSMERLTQHVVSGPDEWDEVKDSDTALDWISEFGTLGFPNNTDGTQDVYLGIR